MVRFRRRDTAVRDWHPSKLTVHPGLHGRLLTRTAIESLAGICDPVHGSAPQWASGLQQLPNVHLLPDADPSSTSQLTWLVGAVSDEQRAYVESIPKPDSPFAQFARYVHDYWEAVLTWARAAITAEAIDAQAIKQALNSATVGYAFGTHARDIAIDALATQAQRDQADAVLGQLLQLPGLEQWLTRPDVAHVEHRFDSSARLVGGTPPELVGFSWWASSQIPMPVWIAYDREDPEAFAEDDSHITDADLAAMGMTRAQLLADLERERLQSIPVESTAEVYGDDAGDFAIDHPLRTLRDLRVYELSDVDSVRSLIERYPTRLGEINGTSMSHDWAGTQAPISLGVNWHALAQNYDAVRYGIPAALQLAYVPIVVDSEGLTGTAMLTGWTPGSTIYFVDPVRDH